MPRQSRIDYPGALHHIMVRGIERRDIFRNDADREDFLTRLGVILEERGTPCYAWALIPNHLHLVLRTGTEPIATVMRRLLTGYAVSFNLRHDRRGKLFQNRYKSILCQEDAYFLELVAYVHLNPLRAELVDSLKELDSYKWTGHRVILEQPERSWQDVETVLALFGTSQGEARKQYRAFVGARAAKGRRPELAEGGLLRSLGGWKEVQRHGGTERSRSDERILGDSGFVERVLKRAQERFSDAYDLKSRGFDLEKAAERAAELTGLRAEDLFRKGKQRNVVRGRRVLCYWAVRELGMSATNVAKKLGLTQSAVSKAVREGEKIASEQGWQLGA